MSRRIVVVGGVAGGMSAAARARRLDEMARITVFEAGGFVSFANCGLPYHVAGRIADEGKLLITSPKLLRERFDIDARTGHRVMRIDRARREVEVVEVATGRETRAGYDVLVLATGASPLVPGGLVDPAAQATGRVMSLRSMEDTRALQAVLSRENVLEAVIAGAGFIGIEMAEALVERGVSVTVVERSPHVLPPLDVEMARPVEQELTARGVKLVLGAGLQRVEGTGEPVGPVRVVLDGGGELRTDLVILAMGVRPNVELAVEAGLAIGPAGGIAVDAGQRTSDPAILAVGDATEVSLAMTGSTGRVPLGGPANRQGRAAGSTAAGKDDAPAGAVMGTAIVQAFGMSAGTTGLTERSARSAGRSVDTAYVTAGHHAGYYPGAQPVRLKLVYEVTTARVLGLQAVGRAGVDKRLDIVATLMQFGGTVHDLARLDLAYAPQFGSAKDPLHMAAFVAANQSSGVMRAVYPAPQGAMLVDVRTAEEFRRGTLPGAINLPLEQLRHRSEELPRDREIVTFCQVGQRGYYAYRVLRQRGFDRVSNLKGGYSLAAQLPL